MRKTSTSTSSRSTTSKPKLVKPKPEPKNYFVFRTQNNEDTLQYVGRYKTKIEASQAAIKKAHDMYEDSDCEYGAPKKVMIFELIAESAVVLSFNFRDVEKKTEDEAKAATSV